MRTLVRTSSLSCSRRNRHEYEELCVQTAREESSSSSSSNNNILKSISYRRRRAKQRKVFLTTYKLSSIDHSFSDDEPKSPPKLNKVALKLKKIVAAVLKFMQTACS